MSFFHTLSIGGEISLEFRYRTLL